MISSVSVLEMFLSYFHVYVFSYVSETAFYFLRNKITVSPIIMLFLILSHVTSRKM
jgi:hypothetical protein